MYWLARGNGYWWYQAPIEAQSLLIEAFSEVANDETSVNQMKTWLLKQKQTQNWETTKGTADACYALLRAGGNWLTYDPEVTIQLGSTVLESSKTNTEAGTGYFKKAIAGKDIKPEMGNITLRLDDKAKTGTTQPSWGAVYWQYFEDMDKITPATTPLSVQKEFYVERNTPRGPELQKLTEGNVLKIGDRVKARIILKADRDMEYIHLKDGRPANFEPLDVLSGYRYQQGLGYYMSTLDLSTNFFIDHLRPGTYVFEYGLNVTNAGKCSAGIATIQCMYAPEFSAHSQGIRVTVE